MSLCDLLIAIRVHNSTRLHTQWFHWSEKEKDETKTDKRDKGTVATCKEPLHHYIFHLHYTKNKIKMHVLIKLNID